MATNGVSEVRATEIAQNTLSSAKGVTIPALDSNKQIPLENMLNAVSASNGNLLGIATPNTNPGIPAAPGYYKIQSSTSVQTFTNFKDGTGTAITVDASTNAELIWNGSYWTANVIQIGADVVRTTQINATSGVAGYDLTLNGFTEGTAVTKETVLNDTNTANFIHYVSNDQIVNGNAWYNFVNFRGVPYTLVGIRNKCQASSVSVYKYDTVSRVATLLQTFANTVAGTVLFTLTTPVNISSTEAVFCTNSYYSIGGSKAVKLTFSGGVATSSITDTVEFLQTILYLETTDSTTYKGIKGLNGDVESLAQSNADTLDAVKNGYTSTDFQTGTTQLSYTDVSNYSKELANGQVVDGNMWYNNANFLGHAYTLIGVNSKVKTGNVSVYKFDTVGKALTLLQTFTNNSTGWQTFTLATQTNISATEAIIVSNTYYTTNASTAKKITFAGGVATSVASDVVEICQNIIWAQNTDPITYDGLKGLNENVAALQDDTSSLGNAINSLANMPLYVRLLNEPGNSLSGWTNTNWTASGGFRPTATGSANYLQSTMVYHCDKRFLRFKVTMGVDTFLKIPVAWGGINAGEGASCFGIDFSSKKLVIYSCGTGADDQWSSSGYTTTILESTAIPDAAIGGRDYIVELHKDGLTHTFRILDLLTGIHTEVSHTGWGAGRQNQYYGFYVESGTLPTISNLEVWALNRPDIVFAGDSITEGVYVLDRLKRYAELFRTNNTTKKVVISARGGDNITGLLAKFDTEFNIYRPKMLSVLIGANGGNTLANLQLLKQKCDAVGCALILHHNTCQQATDKHIANNAVIDQVGVNGAKFDIATALGNFPNVDGAHPSPRYNPALYGDAGLHPNVDGDAQMYNRLLIDVPELFY